MRWVQSLLAVALLAAVVSADGLVDDAIVADRLVYLDGNNWRATCPDLLLDIPATVPGDLLTDLYTAHIIPDPLFEDNFLNASVWFGHTWTYTTMFILTDEDIASQTEILLVFDGVKMGATATINGVPLPQTMTNQFVRYTFPLRATGALRAGPNILSVTFDDKIDVGGRYMACTGGWDWAPYTTTFQGQAPVFTKGLWKSVYLATVMNLAIEYVVPHVFYLGSYPTTPLQPHQHGDFQVVVDVHLFVQTTDTMAIGVSGEWNMHQVVSQSVTFQGGSRAVVRLNMTVSAEEIELWWPNRMGEQKLYAVVVTAMQPNGQELVAVRRIGFRYVVMVTGNDTDPAYVQAAATEDGTASQGMFFRVNGAAMFARGANMIPMEELEGRMNAEAHQILVQSAADVGMNIFRVWGGGIYLPNIFYDTCDQLGIVLYHDIMYAQLHPPTNDAINEAEIRHQVRRLSHHPSIVMWDSCNECVAVDNPIYYDFVMPVVVDEDVSRPIWPSCPADGWASGVVRLTSMPNGKPPIPIKANTIETHGPYQHGAGFHTVNSPSELNPFNPNLPITIKPTDEIGVQFPNVFASEFGCSVMSSFESMSAQLLPEHWGIHGGEPESTTNDNVMAQRNYACDNIIEAYFGLQPKLLNMTGELPFKRQLYLCMLGQALEMKADIETRRTKNQFGIVTWQLNEIWPTGGWGSIEYGTPVGGQVLGGRWKPLHYFFQNFLYGDVFVICGASGQCMVKNDGMTPINAEVVVNALDVPTANHKLISGFSLDLPAGPGAAHFFKVNLAPFTLTQTMVILNVTDATTGKVLASNVVPLTTPNYIQMSQAQVRFAIADQPNLDGTVDITVSSSKVALYVVLTTRAHGRFSDNAFLLLPSEPQVIKFYPFGGPVDLAMLRATTRIEDLASYILL